MMEKISPHITYAEATRSYEAKKHSIDNVPDTYQLERMKDVAINIFEPIRRHFGNLPIFIWSMFRNKKVNELVGGSSTSQHMANKGAAIDIDGQIFGGMTNREIFDYVRSNLDFDQLIGEGREGNDYGWIHISFNKDNNRKQVKEMNIVKGKKVYTWFKETGT